MYHIIYVNQLSENVYGFLVEIVIPNICELSKFNVLFRYSLVMELWAKLEWEEDYISPRANILHYFTTNIEYVIWLLPLTM